MNKLKKVMQRYCDIEDTHRKTIGYLPLVNLRFTDPEYALVCIIMGSISLEESFIISRYHENKIMYGLHKHGNTIK